MGDVLSAKICSCAKESSLMCLPRLLRCAKHTLMTLLRVQKVVKNLHIGKVCRKTMSFMRLLRRLRSAIQGENVDYAFAAKKKASAAVTYAYEKCVQLSTTT